MSSAIQQLKDIARHQQAEIASLRNIMRIKDAELALAHGYAIAQVALVAAAVAKLDGNPGGDPEACHGEAEDVLLILAGPEVHAAWDRLVERTGGFWYA